MKLGQFKAGANENSALQYFLQGQPALGVMPVQVNDAESPTAAMPEEMRLPINEESIQKAAETMRKYREGKVQLEKKIVAEEEFWRRRQWKYIDGKQEQTSFATPWLFNCILSKHADVMDSYPAANCLARQRDDTEEAKKLSSIIPVINAQNNFEETYSDLAWYTLKHGGGVYGVFWDGAKHGGLGDITVRRVDFLNFFWEPGISDIQKSANVFHVELVDIEHLKARYPQADGIGTNAFTVTKYIYDDNVDTSGKALVVDWYYHRTNADGRRVLHFCKFVEDVVLFASENDPKNYPNGWYEHGEYPFVVQTLYPVEGSICGEGLISIGAETQIQIDLLNRATLNNALFGCQPRYFKRKDCNVNEEQFADATQPIVEVENSSLGNEDFRLIDTKPLNGNYVGLLENKIEELKYCTSNQDANNGVAPSGITAASAIAALQETAGKNSRSVNKTFHRAFREVVYQEIELIRQFYSAPREFRIIPDVLEQGSEQYVTYSNEHIVPQAQTVEGVSRGWRKPEFDIEVTVEKESPYKKMEINELALNFYKMGFFNPQMCDQALATLRMMDFDGKEKLMQEISDAGTMAQKLKMLQTLAMNLAAKYEPQTAMQLAAQFGGAPGMPVAAHGDVSLGNEQKEPAQVENARERARSSTEVR